jgi:glycosyltransferase involved in cell wall biosynthesis
MAKLRILHCLETVGSGGVEQRRLTLARQLDKDQFEQALMCTKAIDALPEQFVKAGCPLVEIGVFRGIFDRVRYMNALNFIREFKPDIIHGAVYEGVAVAAIAGRLGRVPIIIGEETIAPVNRRWKGHVLYRILTAMTHKMVAISPSVASYLQDGIHVPAGKICRINNGIVELKPPSQADIKDTREKLGIAEDEIVVGFVGRLFEEHKRVGDLIRAVSLLQVRCPKLRLLVVGDGPDRQQLEQRVDSLKLRDKVIFTGYQGNTRLLYPVMDMFALVSRSEGLPLVVPEAMFAKLPVVATNVPGTRDTVTNGGTGVLVELGNVEAIANAIKLLYADKALRAQYGLAGLERARTEFSAERYLREISNLYLDMAKRSL